jgi:predicted kinase
MDVLSEWCPSEAPFPVDFARLSDALPWVRAMRGVPQDPVHHAEGDVWVHTELVLQALVSLPAWQRLPPRLRQLAFAGALLHDVAKPATTRVDDDGRVTARGHSARGTTMTRRLLWEAGVDPVDREVVCALVRRHQVPFFAVEDDDGARRAILASGVARNDLLALVNEADGLGRTCADPQRLADNVALYRVLCEELDCWNAPYAFANPTARLRFARRQGTRHDVPPEVFRTRVVVMSGLPGAGKDTWIREHLPGWAMVSLDALRERLGVDPRDHQGPVVAAAREQAREHLRACRPFVWNATNVTRQHRDRIVNLALDYGAHVRIVQVETARDALLERNRQRADRVPEAVIEALVRRWEVPEPHEAHQVDRVIT